MNVRELLGHPELQLTLVGGDDVQLARAISGTYTIDLPDPGRFLSPGDVVLTSALWTSGRESVERFVGGVADRGVVAIVVGLIAIVLAAINMVGGFVVTDRMLQMFTRKKPAARKPEEAR